MVDIFRFKRNVADEVARVVDGHDDHGKATHNVDGSDAPRAAT
jgi:hypothetical protein